MNKAQELEFYNSHILQKMGSMFLDEMIIGPGTLVPK